MRQKKFKSIRKKSEPMEIDITSLLDILVILLVFLLKSYNASDLTVDVVKGLDLPNSKSETLGNHAIIVQVNKNRKIFINNKPIGVMSGGGEKIESLYDGLISYKEEEKKKGAINRKPSADGKIKELYNKNVNLVIDQNLPYEVMQKVMHTAAIAGFPQFKFIVQGNH